MVFARCLLLLSAKSSLGAADPPHEDAALSLLQMQASKQQMEKDNVRPWDWDDGSNELNKYHGCYFRQGLGEVQMMGVNSRSDLQQGKTRYPGLYNMFASTDGQVALQGFLCWQSANGVGGGVATRGLALKMGDNYISFTPHNWDEAVGPNRYGHGSNPDSNQWEGWKPDGGGLPYGRNLGLGIGLGNTETLPVMDIKYEPAGDLAVPKPTGLNYNGDVLRRLVHPSLNRDEVEILTNAPPSSQQPNIHFYIKYKPLGMQALIKYIGYGLVLDYIYFEDGQFDNERYYFCNMQNWNNTAKDLNDYMVAGGINKHIDYLNKDYGKEKERIPEVLKHVAWRSGSKKGWKPVDNPKTPNYEANMFDAIVSGTNAKYCKYCKWKIPDSFVKNHDHAPYLDYEAYQKCESWTYGSKYYGEDGPETPDAEECKEVIKSNKDAKKSAKELKKRRRELRKELKHVKLQMEEAEGVLENTDDIRALCENES